MRQDFLYHKLQDDQSGLNYKRLKELWSLIKREHRNKMWKCIIFAHQIKYGGTITAEDTNVDVHCTQKDKN